LEIQALGRIDIEHETNLGNHDQWVSLLGKGSADLNGLKVRLGIPSNDDPLSNCKTRPIGQIEEQRETEAIEGDKAELNQAVGKIRAQPPLPLQRRQISIYRMEDPLREPLVLGELVDRTCEQVMTFMKQNCNGGNTVNYYGT
jgi:hypothetical protein